MYHLQTMLARLWRVSAVSPNASTIATTPSLRQGIANIDLVFGPRLVPWRSDSDSPYILEGGWGGGGGSGEAGDCLMGQKDIGRPAALFFLPVLGQSRFGIQVLSGDRSVCSGLLGWSLRFFFFFFFWCLDEARPLLAERVSGRDDSPASPPSPPPLPSQPPLVFIVCEDMWCHYVWRQLNRKSRLEWTRLELLKISLEWYNRVCSVCFC